MKLDEIREQMCDHFCRVPIEAKDEEEVEALCSKCPLNELEKSRKTDNKYRKQAKRWKNKWLKSQKSGKWIIDRSVLPYTYTCNICGRNVFDDYDYCPFCGCAMKQERSE